MLRVPRRKEVPRDFLKGKIEKFTGKLERAKSAGNEEDITKYTAKVKKFQEQFDALPPEKMEPYELPEGTTDDDADAYVEHLSSRAAAKGNMGIVLCGNRETISRRWRRAPEI
jgi:hypothetical protein